MRVCSLASGCGDQGCSGLDFTADLRGAGDVGRELSEWEEYSLSRLPLEEEEKDTLWLGMALRASLGRCHRNFCFSEPAVGVGVAEAGIVSSILGSAEQRSEPEVMKFLISRLNGMNDERVTKQCHGLGRFAESKGRIGSECGNLVTKGPRTWTRRERHGAFGLRTFGRMMAVWHDRVLARSANG